MDFFLELLDNLPSHDRHDIFTGILRSTGLDERFLTAINIYGFHRNIKNSINRDLYGPR